MAANKSTYNGEVTCNNDFHVYLLDGETGNSESVVTLDVELLREAQVVGSHHLCWASKTAKVDKDLIESLVEFTNESGEDHCHGDVSKEASRNMTAILAAEEVVSEKLETFTPAHPEYAIYQDMKTELQKQKQDILISYVSTVFSTPKKLAALFNYLDKCQKEMCGQEKAGSILAIYMRALSVSSQRRLWAKNLQSLKKSAGNNSSGDLDQGPSWAHVAAAIELSTFAPPSSSLCKMWFSKKIARIAPVLAEIEVHLTPDVFRHLTKQRQADFRKLHKDPQNCGALAFLPVFDLLAEVATVFGLMVPTKPFDHVFGC